MVAGALRQLLWTIRVRLTKKWILATVSILLDGSMTSRARDTCGERSDFRHLYPRDANQGVIQRTWVLAVYTRFDR